MTKRFVALAVLIFAWLTIGESQDASSGYAKAFANLTASAFQQPAARAAPNVTWEYRILTGSSFHIATLESSINKLSEQGYAVESFLPVSSVGGGRGHGAESSFTINSSTEVFVLLKRIRK